MMLFCLFLLFIPFYTYTCADIYAEGFEKMREHFEKCPVMCTNPACATKKIPGDQYKPVYRDVYYTYHRIEEVGSDENMRLFINYYGQMLACKHGAQCKNELILCLAITDPSSYSDKRYKNICAPNLMSSNLSDLRVPRFNIVQDQSGKRCSVKADLIFKPKYDPVSTEIFCCAESLLPPEVTEMMIYNIHCINSTKKQYLYSFFDTSKTTDKRYLFRLVNLSNVQRKIGDYFQNPSTNSDSVPFSKAVRSVVYRDILVDNIFNVELLDADLDVYDNNSRRIAILCTHEKKNGNVFYSCMTKEARSYSLMLVTHEELYCSTTRNFSASKYSIEDIHENHAALMRGEPGEEGKTPFNNSDSQIITGSEAALKQYVAIAQKRQDLKTKYLYKNEAASTDECEVFNNAFGDFVVYRDGKPIVLPRRKGNFFIYNALYDNDALTKEVLERRSADFAQAWKKSGDGECIYYCEENSNAFCEKVWPYKHELASRWFVDKKNCVELDDDIKNEPFTKYRFWTVPLYKAGKIVKKSVFLSDRGVEMDIFCADYPYQINTFNNGVLMLECDKSPYILFAQTNGYKDNIPFDLEMTQLYVNCFRVYLLYRYKDQEMHTACQKNYLNFLHQKEAEKKEVEQRAQERLAKEEQEKKDKKLIDMGLLLEPIAGNDYSETYTAVPLNGSVNSRGQSQPVPALSVTNDNPKYWVLHPLRYHVPRLIGGIVIGAAVGGLCWFMHKQPAVNLKLPAPTV